MIPNVHSQPIDTILAEDGITPLRGKAACNRINEYFCTISDTLSSKLKQGTPWSDPCNSTSQLEIWGFEIGEDEVLRLIEDINDEKSSGFFCVSSKLIKQILRIIVSQFMVLLNLVLKHSVFPVGWKTAITTVIPKSGSTMLVNNLRPLSSNPITGKIMEKIINSIIMDYLESNGKLFVRQGGFSKRSIYG